MAQDLLFWTQLFLTLMILTLTPELTNLGYLCRNEAEAFGLAPLLLCRWPAFMHVIKTRGVGYPKQTWRQWAASAEEWNGSERRNIAEWKSRPGRHIYYNDHLLHS